MPRSRLRRRSAYIPPEPAARTVRVGSPSWLAPLMVACFVLGLLWVVVFYVTQAEFPVRSLGLWNMAVGFGLIVAGFVLAIRWR